jgi:hypothetical protein
MHENACGWYLFYHHSVAWPFDFTFKKLGREDEEREKDGEKGKVMNWTFSNIFVTPPPHFTSSLKAERE